MPEEAVYVVINGDIGSEKSCYHTNENCPPLQKAEKYTERSLDQVPNREECSLCADEWSPHHDRDEEFVCSCGNEYSTQNGYSRHVLQKHPERVEAVLGTYQAEPAEPIADGGQLRGPPKCPNCGHDPNGDDDTFTSGGGWIFDNSISDGMWTEELHCPVCKDVVAREEKSMGAGGGLR